MGTVGLVSQAYGRKDYSEIFNIVLRNLIFILTIFIILISLQNYIFRLSLNIFDLSVATEKFYKDYFQIRIWSAPGELTLYIITGFIYWFTKNQDFKFSGRFIFYIKYNFKYHFCYKI